MQFDALEKLIILTSRRFMHMRSIKMTGFVQESSLAHLLLSLDSFPLLETIKIRKSKGYFNLKVLKMRVESGDFIEGIRGMGCVRQIQVCDGK